MISLFLRDSQVLKVLREKRVHEKTVKQTQREQIESIKLHGTYVGKLIDEFSEIDKYLEDDYVDFVIIEVPQQDDTQFERAKSEEQLQSYDIERISPTRHKVFIRTIDLNSYDE